MQVLHLALSNVALTDEAKLGYPGICNGRVSRVPPRGEAFRPGQVGDVRFRLGYMSWRRLHTFRRSISTTEKRQCDKHKL